MNTVKYHNELNTVSFGSFREKELDLFFSICFKLRDTETREVELSFDELKKLSSYSNRNLTRFIYDLESTYDKLLGLNIKIKYSELNFEKFNLFTRYCIVGDQRKIIIQVNDKFEYILNKLLGNYTKFDLLEFVNLKSMYSKNLFKLLKQWEKTRERTFEIEEFRTLLGVPKSYTTGDFNKRVLSPILKELPTYFKNLSLEKIKIGRKHTHLKFIWEKNTQSIDKMEFNISNKLHKVIERVRKNRYLQNYLADDKLYKFIEKYDEDNLIKGLNFLYREVKKEVPNFTYLSKIFETGLKEPSIEIKVIPEKKSEIVDIEVNKEKANESLFIIFKKMPENIKLNILYEAKQMYMKDIGIITMNSMYEKFFKVAEKKYILKILGGEINDLN